jgi:hypothetical protein
LPIFASLIVGSIYLTIAYACSSVASPFGATSSNNARLFAASRLCYAVYTSTSAFRNWLFVTMYSSFKLFA